jgi:uncharacterized protein (DUF4415 family)
MASRVPPRFVPTLTEVVRPGAGGAEPTPPAPAVSQEQIVQRVMQRVDASLERRLREALAAAIVEHTRTLGPIVQDEIEAVVRQAVADAFEDEFGRTPRS